MEENSFPNNEDKKITQVETEQKMAIGVKVVISVAVIGAIAAGVFIALLISQ